MSMTHTKRLLILVLAAGIFIAVVIAIQSSGHEKNESYFPVFSTTFTDRNGTHALYRLLQGRGFEVEKNYIKFEKIDDYSGGNIVMLAPLEAVLPESRQRLLNWVGAGSCLIACQKNGSNFLEETGLNMHEVSNTSECIAGKGGFHAAGAGPLSVFAEKMKYVRNEIPELTEVAGFSGAINGDFTSHFTSKGVTGFRPLFQSDAGEVLVAYMPYGLGGIYILSNPYVFTNEGLGKDGNAEFVLALFTEVRRRFPGIMVFDEYHHGFHADEFLSPLRFEEVRYMLWGLLLTFALLIWSFSRRDRRPLPLIRKKRRSITEFLSSMAVMYRQKGGEVYLVDEILNRFWTRIIRTLGLPSHQSGKPDTRIIHLAGIKWGPEAESELKSMMALASQPGDSGTRLELVRKARQFSIAYRIELHGQ